MKRILLAAAVGSAIGAGGLSLAQHGYEGPEKVRTSPNETSSRPWTGRKPA